MTDLEVYRRGAWNLSPHERQRVINLLANEKQAIYHAIGAGRGWRCAMTAQMTRLQALTGTLAELYAARKHHERCFNQFCNHAPLTGMRSDDRDL